MASRSSSGIGVGITITLLGVVCLALFITTIVFLSKYNATRKTLKDTQDQVAEYVRPDEQQNDTISRLREVAKRNSKSVVGYLNSSLQETMYRATGARNDTLDALGEKLKRIEGAATSSLVGVIGERDRSIADLNTKLEQADKDRQTALANLANEAARVKQLSEAHQQTIAAMNADIERYKAEVDTYRQGVGESKTFMDQQVEKVRDVLATTESGLNERIRGLEIENLQLKDQLAKLRKDNSASVFTGPNEASLADGNVISIDPGNTAITFDRGRRDKVILGMRFSVYSHATAIRPGASGEYPAGKAIVEVVNVGETSSSARVIQETKGNPVVRGDVVANAIYDPNKVYTFLVYGNFDANGDGVPTPAEAEDVKALIQSWGAKVAAEISGEVDFLVLGQRPILPPPPGVNDPLPVVLEYQRLDAMANKYDELFRTANSTSIPVLNENRLYTLIGGRPNTR
jgi:hypothetical protein